MVTSGSRGLPAAGVHFLLCDFGELGRSFVETDPDGSSAAAVVEALLQGQYRRPLRVIVLMPQGIWRLGRDRVRARPRRRARRQDAQ